MKEIDFKDNRYLDDIRIIADYCENYNTAFALASVQIGIPKRIIYLRKTDLDSLYDDDHNEKVVMINPKIINKQGKTKYWEACVSCLDNMGLVTRPYKIKLEYYDIDGNKHVEDIEGFKTTVICHELDHLDGILHIDIAEEILHMNPDERKTYRETHPYEIISKE